ncbi:GntR family transcriptional repressor for pyruvate dehydrogenase complex [Caldalkalibacillus uzonensis]|uniref:GntR family transcriptional repressor for pyruvate dehydrogenase complex n=1 Tax=Caldalkalibacillus uzonensis TaxID=353224 RepID=A0ABU0CMF2_9BACI|nr:FadR/GntR family transcriptional regulator [Caldalkalibacillus uzonensis]MDQ0337600.1 GntR family transcriptional repressor for pyruvate dehydrogenase complex [Caldalkalibacillus uzonensis]
MNVEKITPKKISEQVAEQLEQWIISQHLQPGDKLPSVRQLCDMFDVGRSAVRDAITTLKGKGILEVKQGEGAFIRSFDSAQLFEQLLLLDKQDLTDVFNVRKILEVGSAELASTSRTAAHVQQMEKALQMLENSDSLEDWEADYAFHMAIAEATRNKVIIRLMETVSVLLKKAIINCHNMALHSEAVSSSIRKQHVAIYLAIKEQKAEQAREAMFEHLCYVEALLNKK